MFRRDLKIHLTKYLQNKCNILAGRLLKTKYINSGFQGTKLATTTHGWWNGSLKLTFSKRNTDDKEYDGNIQ